jgi:Uma2 family endonuclease
MTVRTHKPKPSEQTESVDGAKPIPSLNDGDRLTRDEFERRYDSMPNLNKAELIEGVVRVPSPVRQRHHSSPHFRLVGWLFMYRARTPGVEGGANPSVRMDMGTMPQPDCLLYIDPKHGGQAAIDEDDYLNGSPNRIAEVAASSVSYDLHEKLEAYRRNGVREYIVWRVDDQKVDWFVLREGGYGELAPETDGTLHSTVFPGLWLDPAALLHDDFDTLLGVLERGLDSPEHADFAETMRPQAT